MLSQAVQDYLKTIYKLQEDGPVATTEIAKELSVSGASVTGMLKRLSNMDLVDYNSYKGVKLTNEGEMFALEIIRRHRLLELYLREKLGFSLDKVHEEACRLEHYISEDFEEKISKILSDPKYDPHGHPIPNKDGKISDSNEIPLADVDVGSKVIIRRVADKDPNFLTYLEELKLLPDTKLEVIEKSPFNGPVTVYHDKEKRIVGQEVARNIFVDLV